MMTCLELMEALVSILDNPDSTIDDLRQYTNDIHEHRRFAALYSSVKPALDESSKDTSSIYGDFVEPFQNAACECLSPVLSDREIQGPYCSTCLGDLPSKNSNGQ